MTEISMMQLFLLDITNITIYEKYSAIDLVPEVTPKEVGALLCFYSNIKEGAGWRHSLQLNRPVIKIVRVVVSEDVLAFHGGIPQPAQRPHHEVHAITQPQRPSVLYVLLKDLEREGALVFA